MTRIHERYLALSLPFLLLTSGIYPVFWFSYGIISFTHFLNLYNGFFQPNLPLLTRAFALPWLIKFLILINFAILIYLLIKIVKELRFALEEKIGAESETQLGT